MPHIYEHIYLCKDTAKTRLMSVNELIEVTTLPAVILLGLLLGGDTTRGQGPCW